MYSTASQFYSSLGVLLLALGLIITYFFRSVIRHNRKAVDLQRENANAAVNALEKDRARIATDLHDGVSPRLAGIRMMINSFELVKESDTAKRLTVNSIVDELSDEVRKISYDLMPSSLQKRGLILAVQQFINEIQWGNNISISFNPPDIPVELELEKAVNIFRIVQEIVLNTHKHAEATNLFILLVKEKNTLVLYTEDNGRGFDYRQKLKDSNGFGLKSLKNRAHLLKAEIVFQSAPGKGTSIDIRIPLK